MYYKEIVKREPNRMGKPRLVSILSDVSGARCHGFDGDGTAPKRGQEAGRYRLWELASKLSNPLPEGVASLSQAEFDKAVTDREAAKPVPPPIVEADPEEAPFTPDEFKRLRILLRNE